MERCETDKHHEPAGKGSYWSRLCHSVGRLNDVSHHGQTFPDLSEARVLQKNGTGMRYTQYTNLNDYEQRRAHPKALRPFSASSSSYCTVLTHGMAACPLPMTLVALPV